jgi:hypothetical protein
VTDQAHVIATVEVGGRRLRFDAIFCQNRLRITMPRSASGDAPGIASEDAPEGARKGAATSALPHSEALGSVVHLDSAPGLRINSPLHADWATRHCAAIIAEAVRIWTAALRECDG